MGKRKILIITLLIIAILNLNGQELNDSETDGLLLMREEEKLARDVYNKLYEIWNLSVFSNIARSEQTHMDKVKTLLDQFDIPDPTLIDVPGVFINEGLQEAYNGMVETGGKSIYDALYIGATIEDLDIYDLEELMHETENSDITAVYTSLRDASINHMNSFNNQLKKYGEGYKAQYISQVYLNEILK
jgi:hypothetical protein